MAAQARNNPNSRFGRDKKNKPGSRSVNRTENRSDNRKKDNRSDRDAEAGKPGVTDWGRYKNEGKNKSERPASSGRSGENKPGRFDRGEGKPGERDNSGKFRSNDRDNRDGAREKTGTGERRSYRKDGEEKPSFDKNRPARPSTSGRISDNKPGRFDRRERKPGERDNSGKFRSNDRDNRDGAREKTGTGERRSYRKDGEERPSFDKNRTGRPASSNRDRDDKPGRFDRRERKPGERDNSGKFRSNDRDNRDGAREKTGTGERRSYRKDGEEKSSFDKNRPTRPLTSGRDRDDKPGRFDRRERKPGERDNSGKFRNEDRDRSGKRKTEKTGKYERPGRRTAEKPEDFSSKPQTLRLNKYIANSGICARREADELIAGGYVTVNGEKITEMGTKVAYSDQVKVRGKLIMPEKKVYVLLNKPKDYITTLDDPYAKKTVVQLVREACPERIYPVGRLDKNTTGVLLFTNDGELAKKLTHPSSNVPKVYQVQLDNPLTKNHLQDIATGFTLDDGPIKVDEISFIDDLDHSQVGVQIHSGRNRIVRRIFEHFGYKVKKLDRVFFAGLTKQKLSRGKWRFLSEKEISRLKMNIFE